MTLPMTLSLTSPRVRRLCPQDLPALMRVQARCYPPALVEAQAVFANRLAVAPEQAWGWWPDADAPELTAYLVGYRSCLGAVAHLGSGFAPQSDGACLYLHDLAVDPDGAGQGWGRGLVAQALSEARAAGLTHAALVAVAGADRFWQRLGWTLHATLSPQAQQALASYGAGAVYMSRPL